MLSKKNKEYFGFIILSIIILFLITIIIGLIINMENPLLKNMNSSNDWIGYFGNIVGGVLGAIVALIIYKTQSYKRELEDLKGIQNFISFFKNSHLNQLKQNLGIYRNQVLNYIEQFDENNSQFPLMPMLNLNENFYEEKIYQVSQMGIIPFNIYEEYNDLATQIKFINQVRKSNFDESLLLIKLTNNYMTQHVLKNPIGRIFTDNGLFVKYLNMTNQKWKKNFEVVHESIELAIEKINKIQNEI